LRTIEEVDEEIEDEEEIDGEEVEEDGGEEEEREEEVNEESVDEEEKIKKFFDLWEKEIQLEENEWEEDKICILNESEEDFYLNILKPYFEFISNKEENEKNKNILKNELEMMKNKYLGIEKFFRNEKMLEILNENFLKMFKKLVGKRKFKNIENIKLEGIGGKYQVESSLNF